MLFNNKLISIGFLVLLYSCTSPQKLIYLQDQKRDNANLNELVKSVRLQEMQYKLQPTDRLQLTISSAADEKINFIKTPVLEVVVDNKGQIDLPAVGPVTVGGLTIKAAEQQIDSILVRNALKAAFATIKLLNFNITVIGEVANQGTFNSTETRFNILEALGKAGGLTENANRENIRIVRTENNTAKIYQINILEDNTLLSPNYFLQPNDIVLVSPLKAKAQAEQTTAKIGLVISVISVITSALFLVFRD